MGKKKAKKVVNNSSTGTTTNNFSVKVNKKFLQEEIQSIITNSKRKNNLIKVAISSKDTRILELFTKNGGKLTTNEVLEKFEYIAGNDRVDIKIFYRKIKIKPQ